MARKAKRRRSTAAKKPPKNEKPTGLAHLRNAKSPDDAGRGIVETALVNQGDSLHQVGIALANAAEAWPNQMASVSRRLASCAVNLAALAEDGNDTHKALARRVLLFRQRIIDELEIDTAAEFMLLDAGLDAYLHWMDLTALVRITLKDGTNADKSRLQARIAGMAQSYLKTYAESVKALNDMKRPPIRVLQIRAGENVAVQINEKTKVLEARHVPKLPDELERKTLPESAPAVAEAAREDPDRSRRPDRPRAGQRGAGAPG